MKISDLQPLDKVFISKRAFEEPDSLIYVHQGQAGELDFMCDDDFDNAALLCAAFLPVMFPQLRSLGDIPVGQTAVFDGKQWSLEDIEYEDGEGPGDFPAPPERSLGNWPFTCACCGKRQSGLPEIGFHLPSSVAAGHPDFDILEQGEDLCRVRAEGTEYFWIRGLLPLRITDARDTWSYGAWTTISAEDFERYDETFDGEQRDLGVMYGYLSNVVPGVPDSIDLLVNIIPNLPGQRPWLLLQLPDDPHPLFDAQQTGITVDTLMEWIGPHLSCDGNA